METKAINKEQQVASNPEYSIWLSASAGSGKTKVLTDRVLRMLLQGVNPQRILCLTFTNAAANEMQERILGQISKWSNSKASDLERELEELTGSSHKKSDILRAKGLLAEQLSKTESINIYTIHSFCQKLLKQFPVEAGIVHNFKIIDEINQQKILERIRYSIISDESLQPVIISMLSQMHDSRLNELVEEILSDHIKFKNLFEAFSAASYELHLRAKLGACDIEEIIDCSKSKLAPISFKLNIQGIKDSIISYIEASYQEAPLMFRSLKELFLTQQDQKKKKLLSKLQQDKYPGQLEYLIEVQDIVFQTLDKINTLKLVQDSTQLYNLAKGVVKQYESLKKEKNFLDYDDLIYYTYGLFTKSEFKDWILYKLDGGIEHILVDEAQDTNLNQWQLILAMISDFVAGESASVASKSIFIVGDEKQSIYSFQGAVYEQFAQIKSQILQQLSSAQKKYQVVNLATSYRSSQTILSTVDKIFTHVRKVDEEFFESDNFALQCHFKKYGGRIELWPVYKKDKKEELFWPIFTEQEDQDSCGGALAKDIALYIKKMLDSKIVLFSTGAQVRPADFMILLRQRNDFANKIVKELKNLQLPVSGLDKIDLFEDLSVLDLLAAAKFTIAMEDELSLACLLKSPIFGLTESQLFELAHNRGQNLYSKICSDISYDKIKNKLDDIINLAQSSSIRDFFYILVYGFDHLSSFLSQNGLESSDSINELINLAFKFEQEVSSSMHEFITWCNKCNFELKRDISGGDVIKIMTIHGSKGLQSPIVILPDTTSMPKSSYKFLWYEDLVFFSIKADQYCSFYNNVKDLENKKQYKEYLRLLYVATTRACEQIVFCGHSSSENVNTKCWYSLIEGSLRPIIQEVEGQQKSSFVIEDKAPRLKVRAVKQETSLFPLINLSVSGDALYKNLKVLEQSNSPLIDGMSSVYGQIVHKILEESFYQKDIQKLLSHNLMQLLPEQYASHLKQKLAELVENKEFKNLFNLDLKTEVNISSSGQLGRIDLLAIDKNTVTIIDYKTDKKVPERKQDVAEKYLTQLDFYKQAVKSLYPGRNIESKILWIMSARFMDL